MSSIVGALTLRELLRPIFQYCDPRDNFHNALVSKTWSDEALDILWNQLHSMRPLFSLLAPLVIQVDGKYVC